MGKSTNKTVLILGGYGNFGKRITESLCSQAQARLLVAGRNLKKAESLVQMLQPSAKATLEAVRLDILAADFESKLIQLSPDIVIHTSGPFQGQDYRVPSACIQAKAHYIDLADDRRFVCDIEQLDDLAKANSVLLISGASSVPGLSSVVVDHYRDQFQSIESLDIAIAPGNQAERGEATVRAILSYTGKRFSVFSQGKWQDIYGWMNARKVDFGGVLGKRWLANVDVPDLELFQSRYSVNKEVRFQAGLELSVLHLTMVGMAYLVKKKLVKNWSPLTKLIVATSNLFLPFGTDQGGMKVDIKGVSNSGELKSVQWTLFAEDGVGPYIPTLSTIIIAKKLLNEEVNETGAKSCLGLYSLEEFMPYADELKLYFEEVIVG